MAQRHETAARQRLPLHVRHAGVELLGKTRGAEHADAIVVALVATSDEVERFHGRR